MRLQKTLSLGDNRSVTVLELRVRDARNIMAQAKELEQVDIRELLAERFDEVAALLNDCVRLPDAESLEDLSFSELETVKDGLLEVNASFLGLLGLAGQLPETPSDSSTGPVSSSSSEAIAE